MIRRYAVWLMMCASLGGCSRAMPLRLAHLPAAPAPYRVQVGDILAVRVYIAPELNEDVTVAPDGRITTTLAQSVPAAGRTPEEIAADLRRDYASELKNPQLTVAVKSASPSRVFVAGEVVAPGEFATLGPGLTLVEAVARAGGLRAVGDPDHVLILRHGAASRPVVLTTDYAGAVSGRDPAADITLQPFDVIYVPKTGIARVYVWFNQHFQQFVPVSWGFSYNVDPFVTQKK